MIFGWLFTKCFQNPILSQHKNRDDKTKLKTSRWKNEYNEEVLLHWTLKIEQLSHIILTNEIVRIS